MSKFEQETFASFDGEVLSCYRAGEGPDVILLHGFSMASFVTFGEQSAFAWADSWPAGAGPRPGGVGGPPGPCWADALLAAGACVTMLDVRGHGGSAAARAPRTCEELAGDVTRLLDHLELAAADLVGYSMGALIAARLLGREARLRSVVLAGAGAYFLHGRAGLLLPAVASGFIDGDWSQVPEELAAGYRHIAATDPRNNMTTLGHVFEVLTEQMPASRLSASAVPVLLLNGRDDPSAVDLDVLAAAIPHSRVEWGDLDHLTAIRDPAMTTALISFLSEQWTT